MIYGCASLSTEGPSLDAQVAELKAAGCERIFQEKISGAESDRKELAKALGKLGLGDTLVVCHLDRLARSSRGLLNILHEIGAKDAKFRSIRDSWVDTSTPHGRLMLSVLGGLAEFERSLILTRTSEGRERAKRDGVSFGRPPRLTAHQRREAVARKEAGENLAAIARSYAVSYSTISRI